MAKAIICDRCGKVFKDTDEHYLMRHGEASNGHDSLRKESQVYDLCEKCSKSLEYFMQGFATVGVGSVDG